MGQLAADGGYLEYLEKSKDLILARIEEARHGECVQDRERYLPIAEPDLGGKELFNLVNAYLSTWISSTGEYVEDFEDNFAQYCGMEYGVTVSNGTCALHLALAALGIGPGDEVIVPDITFASTANAVLYTGARPVLVDIEKDSWCLDADEMQKAITPRTKAVIPVHIYGQPCCMDRILEIANKRHLFVVEDCAEAHGAKYSGKQVGSFGIINCFSFYGNKVITTGEGGICVTDDKRLDAKMRMLRDHGMNKQFRYYHDAVGFNYRITNLQAAVGLAQLESIGKKLAWREKLEDRYIQLAQDIPGISFQEKSLPKRQKVAWLVTAYVKEPAQRESVMRAMKEADIDARPFFIPLSEMGIYRQYKFSDHNSKYISRRGFNLPTLHKMEDCDIKRVLSAVKKGLENGAML